MPNADENELISQLKSEAGNVNAPSPYDPDPIVALFNNSIWQQKGRNGDSNNGMSDADRPYTKTFTNSVQQRVAAKRVHILTLLRSSLVPPHLLRDILDATGSWWNGFRPLGPMPREVTTTARYSTLQDFLLHAYNSDNPPVVGLAVLCIAVSILGLNNDTHSHLVQQLPRPAAELFQVYFERVDRLINTDSDFASSREGIECMTMSAKCFEGLGFPKKSWLLFGKAIIYGQYLGMHRPHLSSSESEMERNHRYLAWSSLCQADLFLSMLLGLPYTADGSTIPMSFYGEQGTTTWFMGKLSEVAARLIDRNQRGQSSTIDITQNLQNVMDATAAKMPARFWEAFELLGVGSMPTKEAFDCFHHQSFYFHLRVFLHLPLMLLSIEQPHLNAHRLACLDGCRGVLRCYQIFRTEYRIDIPSIIDYSAFICASLLLLGVLGYGVSPRTFQEIDQESDRDLVSRTLSSLKHTSSSSNNNVASQALEGLQTLFQISQHRKCPGHLEGRKDHYAKITIPYFGQVIISPGNFLNREVAAHDESPTTTLPTFILCQNPMSQDAGHPTCVMSANDANGAVGNNMHGLHINEGRTSQGQVPNKIASIDFDWNSLMNMNSEDWSWLADIDSSDMTKFL